MKRALFILFVGIGCVFAKAENTGWKVNGELLIYSQHIWRGMRMGDTQTVEPSVTFSKGSFFLNFWAAKTFNDSYTEIDIIPSFKLGNYQVTLFDYYNPGIGADNNYFSFKEGESCHSAELAVSKNVSSQFPVRLFISSFFFGDKNPATGKPFYSTYAEAVVPFKLLGLTIEPTLGMTTHKGYYADHFAVINTSLAVQGNIALYGKLQMPVKLLLVYNPYRKEKLLSVGTGVYF